MKIGRENRERREITENGEREREKKMKAQGVCSFFLKKALLPYKLY